MNSLLRVKHLSGGYQKKTIVHEVNFAIHRGEFCALLGLNGCGKSTLLKSICGLLPVHAGSCLVLDTDCTHMHEQQRAQQLAYIPQRGSLIAGKSVLEVVLMGFNARLRLLESPGAVHRRKARDTLAILGMEALADRDYDTLSEGQKQLVILARALVQDTPVMLMDEPDSALDFVNRNMVLSKIRETIHSQGRAGLITLHDPNFALAYCDRLLLMVQGRIVRELFLADAKREEVEAALTCVYGDIHVLEYEHGFVMVRG